MKKFYIKIPVSGHVSIPVSGDAELVVEAKDLEEAKRFAEEQFQKLNFGQLEGIETGEYEISDHPKGNAENKSEFCVGLVFKTLKNVKVG